VLAQGLADTLTTTKPGAQQQIAPAQVPADVAGLLRLGYTTAPGATWLTLFTVDGEACQLLVPLLQGRITTVGLDRSSAGLPIVELLVVQAPLLRQHIAAQRRILWAQRFFRTERRSHVPAIVAGLDNEPLALAMAGYASLSNGDEIGAQSLALRLQALLPDSGDSLVLVAEAVRLARQSSPPLPPTAQLPIFLNGLQYAVLHQPPAAPHSPARIVFRAAVLTQIWVVVRGTPIALANLKTPQQEYLPLSRPEQVRKSIAPLLLRMLHRYFNISELRSLCFDLGIDYEDLSGENKSDKVRELVAYMDRHGRTSDLLSICKQLRPLVSWPLVE